MESQERYSLAKTEFVRSVLARTLADARGKSHRDAG